MPFTLWRSILRRWPNAAAVRRSRTGGSMPSGSAIGRKWTIAEATLGGGREGAAVDGERDPRLAPPLRGNRKPAIMLVAGARDDPLGDFALEHQGQRAPPRRPRPGQPAQQQGGADIVGQVGDDMRAVADAGRARRSPSHRPRPAELAGKVGAKLVERRDAAPVALDRDDRRAGVEQGAGQSAGAGADLIDACRLRRRPAMAAMRPSNWRSRMKFWPSAFDADSPWRAMISRSGSGRVAHRDGGAVRGARLRPGGSPPPSRAGRRGPARQCRTRCHGRARCGRSAGRA